MDVLMLKTDGLLSSTFSAVERVEKSKSERRTKDEEGERETDEMSLPRARPTHGPAGDHAVCDGRTLVLEPSARRALSNGISLNRRALRPFE